MANGIPDKGRVLTGLSLFWFGRLGSITPHHLIEAVGDRAPKGFEPYIDQLRGRSMVVRKTQVVPIEAVVRGYLAGSGWKEYQETGRVCGVALPPGLKQCDPLPEPIFTPATKEESGHDRNVSFEEAARLVGRDVMTAIRDRSIALYVHAAEYAREGLIVEPDVSEVFTIELVDEVVQDDGGTTHEVEAAAPHDSDEIVIAVVDEN